MIRRIGLKRLAATLLALTSATAIGCADAADFTIGSGETVAATQDLGSNSTGIVEQGGTIEPSGFGNAAIIGTDENYIYNYGTIASLISGEGIELENENYLFNYGTIETSASASTVTSGDAVHLNGDGNFVINWGTIRVSGGHTGYGMHVVGEDNSITNYGTIETFSDGSNGVHIEAGDNTIINHGIITAAGTTADAIFVNGNSTIINSGTLISLQDDAIQLSDDGNIVYLLAGSAVYGDLDLHDSSDNSYDIGNGLNAMLTFESYFPDHVYTNGMPYVARPADLQLAVVDPTGFAMAEDLLADLTDSAFGAVSARLRSKHHQSSVEANLSPDLTVTPTADVADIYESGLYGSGITAWGGLFGTWRNQSASGITWSADQSLAGLIAGFDVAWSESSYAGIFIGAAKADLAVDDEAQDITTDNFWGGAYLSRYSGRYRFDFAALAGWQSNESTRRMVDNTVLGGVDYAVASYDGFFVSPEASMSRDWNFAGQPVNSAFTLRYAGLFLDAYEEDGSNADLTVEGRDVHSLTAKGELIRPFEIQFADSSLLLLEGLAGAEGRYTFGDEVAATLLTENISFDPDNESFTMAGFAGAQATYTALSGAVAMSLGGKASASTDSALTLSARLTAELHF